MCVEQFSEESFDAHAEAGATVVLKFSSGSCPPCRAFAPVFEQVASNMREHVFVGVDVDASPDLVAEFDIESVPTLVVLRAGLIVFRHTGVLAACELERLVTAVAGLDMDDLRRQCAAHRG